MHIPDYYTNPDNWQEYDCPHCGQDFDVSPIPLPGTLIEHCGQTWPAGEHCPNTYIRTDDPDESCRVVPYPQP